MIHGSTLDVVIGTLVMVGAMAGAGIILCAAAGWFERTLRVKDDDAVPGVHDLEEDIG